MSIDIDAMLIYGVHYSEIPDDLIDEVDKLLDNGELDYASPYYDSPRSEWIVGLSCDVNGNEYIDLPNRYMGIPEEIVGLDFKFYVSPHVT